ncbi:unnamed protein product [Hyaloperonospora brassicae]|uniref:Uncharacterized protein n=1 Tax=Hyaloperonospora brassicae TaxID=162125 RepID=A0AAV0UME2_HYABA|nr:unnamed protein product [Hyaloperonospora brassicae]
MENGRSLSIAELVARVSDTTAPPRTNVTCLLQLKTVVEQCPTLESPDDAKLLKQLETDLLSGHWQVTEGDDDDDMSELHVAKWHFLTSFLRVHHEAAAGPVSEPQLQSVLSLMVTDRFVSIDVLAAMAEWLLQLNSYDESAASCRVDLLDVKVGRDDEKETTYLELIKHMYVTLTDCGRRQRLAKMVQKVMVTKEHAKQLVRAGVLRSFLQVALELAEDDVCAVLLEHFNMVGTQVASLVCFQAAASSLAATAGAKNVRLAETKRRASCDLVVKLMLSGVSLVFADAVRMLQLLIDNERCRVLLSMVPDLRGALEKARALARQKNSKLERNEYLRELCETQYKRLVPEIDAFEREHESVVGLPSDAEIGRSGDDNLENPGLESATTCKAQGNAFFRRGNYATAHAFYRHAIAVLRAAQLREETSLELLSVDEMLARCSIGASVRVRSHHGNDWQDAMVADVEQTGASSQVEVMYDADGRDDEWVAISRIRLRMNTALLAAFDDLAVDCFMNMGKALSALGNHNESVQCFTQALALRGGKLVSALYFRGVANIARRDLTAAHQDLRNADQQCRTQQKNSTSGGTSERNTKDAQQMRALHKLIVAAYKKLQHMHANKKRMDKKAIKQMLKYLSTIPGLQDE